MIKNLGWMILGLVLVASGGCSRAQAGSSSEALQGVVELEDEVLGFEVAGRVRSVSVARGDTVQAGAVIATLDDSLARPGREARAAELEAARAQLRLLRAGTRPEELRVTEAQLNASRQTEAIARRNLARVRGLASRDAVPTAQLDELEAQVARVEGERTALEARLRGQRRGARSQELDAAEARVQAATSGLAAEDERLTRYALRAPSSGVVLDVLVEPGEVVSPGAPVVTVADVRHPYVDVFVPQAQVSGIRVGMRANVRVDAEPRPLTGRVEDVGRRTEFTPRFLFSDRERPNLVVRVRVRIDDPNTTLLAGVPAFVTLDRAPTGGPR